MTETIRKSPVSRDPDISEPIDDDELIEEEEDDFLESFEYEDPSEELSLHNRRKTVTMVVYEAQYSKPAIFKTQMSARTLRPYMAPRR